MKCRMCGCTYERACPAGCGWAKGDICTVCARFRAELAAYVEDANRVTKASLARLLVEVTHAPVKARRAR
jgi:predicted Fe-S protein YdhL (DUF1289 family)